jgi:UDP-N-acetylmuramoylalanine--D-glutamate ligase
MVKKILTNVKALILLKTDGGDKIAEAVLKAKKEVSKEDEIKKSENRDFPSLHYAYGLEEAVLKAMALSESGDTVLLSPACASYGMFSNFEERGRAFKDVVKKLVLQDKTG